MPILNRNDAITKELFKGNEKLLSQIIDGAFLQKLPKLIGDDSKAKEIVWTLYRKYGIETINALEQNAGGGIAVLFDNCGKDYEKMKKVLFDAYRPKS